MQVKVYRLAAELRVSERILIRWLQERGYSEARSHDWLSGQLAQAARRSFGMHTKLWVERRDRSGLAQATYQGSSYRMSDVAEREFRSETPVPEGVLEGLRALNETSHSTRYVAQEPLNVANVEGTQRTRQQDTEQDKSSPKNRDPWLELERLQQAMEEQRRGSELQLQALRAQHDKVLQERSAYRQKVLELEGDQSTIAQAYEELRLEHEGLHERVELMQRELTRTLEQGALQKEAWQARAQELEEQVQSGKRLPLQLRELGLEAFEDQVKLFQTLLSTTESATQFFSVIKMVDQSKIQQLVDQWVVPTCAHPLCNQTNKLRNYLSLRVDRAKRCEVCQGELDRRWFQRMLASCERAHIKRLLLVGAETMHARLRTLMEGEAISCRFISSQESSALPRIQSRLGSADLLIIWPDASANPEVAKAYQKEAPIVGCSYIELSGENADVGKMARQILNLILRGMNPGL